MGKISVKVVPSSSRDAVVGWLGKSLKINVKAPPKKGRANAAVIDLLATALGIHRDLIEVVSGHSSPAKILSIQGLDEVQIVTSLKSITP